MPYDHNRSRGSGKKDASGTNDNRTDEFGSRRKSNRQTTTQKQAEHHFGHEFESAGEIRKVMRLEQRFGQRVHNWIDEGMPIEAMGDPEQMEAYRMHKGTPIPWDIQRFNEDSKRRNTSRIMRRRRERPTGDTQVPNSVQKVISSPGHSLEPSIQRAMEDKMGDSFGDVRVHTGPQAAEACDQINARAFTVGNHVAFNHGEYDPSSAEGQHVIAHELAHVRQQTGGAVSMLPAENVELEIDPDPKLEEEAEETAQRVMAGGKLDIQRMHDTEVHVQRKPEEFAGLEIDPDPKLEEEAEEVAQRVMADGKLDIQRLEQGTVPVQRAMGAGDREGGSMPAADSGGGGGESAYQQNRSSPEEESGPNLELAVDDIDDVSEETVVENQGKIIDDLKTIRSVTESNAKSSPVANTAVDIAATGANMVVPGSGLIVNAANRAVQFIRENNMLAEASDTGEGTPEYK